jgi:hypothetical protein
MTFGLNGPMRSLQLLTPSVQFALTGSRESPIVGRKPGYDLLRHRLMINDSMHERSEITTLLGSSSLATSRGSSFHWGGLGIERRTLEAAVKESQVIDHHFLKEQYDEGTQLGALILWFRYGTGLLSFCFLPLMALGVSQP